MKTVLVLDGNHRSALATTRALGRCGIPVTVAGETRTTLAGSSKYRRGTFTYPSPHEHPDAFVASVRKEAAARGAGIVFPMTDLTTFLLLRHRDQFADVVVPSATLETFDTITDKRSLVRLAQHLGVPAPATYIARPAEDLTALPGDLKFPLVLKPYRSTIWSRSRWIPASVHYATTMKQARDLIASHEYFSEHPFLVQEYIRGEAHGIFALYDRGRPVTFFAHRRLREKPPSGGVSVLCESVETDTSLRAAARRILDHVQWHGVAMVEFKLASDNTPYLMEINARFWGSLQLAIDAGVDFPHLLYRLAVGERLEQIDTYHVGVRSRWLLGDLDNLYLTVKKGSPHGLASASKWRAILQFLKLHEKNTRYDTNRLGDIGPFLTELKQYIGVRR